MTEAIIVALITGGLALIGTVISVVSSNRKTQAAMQAAMQTAQKGTDVKIEELTREVRKHNNFAERIPVLEEKVKVANNRIADLERDMDRDRGGYKS